MYECSIAFVVYVMYVFMIAGFLFDGLFTFLIDDVIVPVLRTYGIRYICTPV